jgi:biotin synthase-like enzyme
MSTTKHNWTKEEIIAIYNKPLMDLLYEAASIHRENHDPNVVQVSTLLSIKTGSCPEDCGYCPQAARYHTDIEENDLMSVSQVKAQALRARNQPTLPTTIGQELQVNPFMRCDQADVIAKAHEVSGQKDLPTPAHVLAVVRAWKDRF